MTTNYSELVSGYIDELGKKYFQGKRVGRLQFTMSEQEVLEIHLLPDSFMNAMAAAGRKYGYQMEEFWSGMSKKMPWSKEITFVFYYTIRNCGNCCNYPGYSRTCTLLGSITTDLGECSLWEKKG